MPLPPFGAPPDPAYLRFLDGLKKAAADPTDHWVWRWHAREQKWFTYRRDQWGMDDFGAPDTPVAGALRQKWGFPTSTWEVNELSTPDLFARLQKAAATIGAAHPKAVLVWSPWNGGDWRGAFERPPAIPGPPDGGGRVPPVEELPPECMKRIKDVQAYERSGVITHDQAQRLIEGIVAECT